MRDISEKVSYLQGLSEGLNISESSPQGKIISGMLGVLEEISDSIVKLQYDLEEFKEYVESIDDDLFELEENITGEADEPDDYLEIECSNCGEQLYFESELLEDDDVIEIICPNCNEVVFVNDGSFDYNHSYIDDELGDNFDEETPPGL